MVDKANKIDLEGLLELKEEEIKKKQPIEIEYLNKALQSIAKRQLYCLFHYDEFMKTSSPTILLADRFNNNENIPPEHTARISYEANALAFLHNLHSLFDSFPYVLNLLFREIEDFTSFKIGWKEEFLKQYKKYSFYQELRSFSENETFCRLKGYTNTIKHKHLIRIKNHINKLVFEDFTYKQKGVVKEVKEIDVKVFLTECHDILFPLFIKLYNSIIENKKVEISNI
ncbi:MAG: hypothetical protein PF482_04720 [Desulfobacteraceae bacterium]|jgi:hypothetical protein|nr:hypothetical protein [Desulfobacteraceae bacterium]